MIINLHNQGKVYSISVAKKKYIKCDDRVVADISLNMLSLAIIFSALAASIHSLPVSHPETMGKTCEKRGLWYIVSDSSFFFSIIGGAFQGDMILPKNFNRNPSVRGVAIFGTNFRWPNNTIPYDLSRIPSNLSSFYKIFYLLFSILIPRWWSSSYYCRKHEQTHEYISYPKICQRTQTSLRLFSTSSTNR